MVITFTGRIQLKQHYKDGDWKYYFIISAKDRPEKRRDVYYLTLEFDN
jgi:hypothetical protein